MKGTSLTVVSSVSAAARIRSFAARNIASLRATRSAIAASTFTSSTP
jgi:hypothetical protein